MGASDNLSNAAGGLGDITIPDSNMEMNELMNSSAANAAQNLSTAAAATQSQPVDGPSAPQPPPAHLRKPSTSQIGPATDDPSPPANSSAEPAVNITLLLISSKRHPFRVDEKYLRKRGVIGNEVPEGSADPFDISVYTLKELIWKDWRSEWDPRPTSPHSIRLINFGKILEDKNTLKDCRFNADAPTVVHMTVKPQEMVDDEDAKTGKGGFSRDREGSERSPSCRCVIL